MISPYVIGIERLVDAEHQSSVVQPPCSPRRQYFAHTPLSSRLGEVGAENCFRGSFLQVWLGRLAL